MANWDDGYVSDVPYQAGYFQESAPVWIATAATLLNTRAPDLSCPFRYADLGCGNGVTALVTAATMPQAEVWAFDFNPAHIQSGSDVARRAGLTNIRFEEASFDDLVCRSAGSLPMFDYVSAHGVLSWMSLENRRRLFDVIGQRLASGGIAYISYNVATGWPGMRPVQKLMRLLAEVSPERSDVATAAAFDLLHKMKDAGAALFQLHPGLESLLSRFRGQDQRYVAHELLNGHWHPIMFPAAASAMAAIKCDYIGSATLQNNLAGFTVPAALRDMFDRARDIRLRETLHDIASADGFRRDLYQRGRQWMSPAERRSKVDSIGLVRTFEPVPQPLVLASAFGPLRTDQARCRGLLEVLDSGPRTIGQLRRHEALVDWPGPELLEAVTLLIGAGYLAPILMLKPTDAAISSAARLNAIHAALLERGYSQPYLAYPALGAAWRTHEVEILALDALNAGLAAEEQPLVDAAYDRLALGGQQLQRDGHAVNDPVAMRETITGQVRQMLEHHLPVMRRLGALARERARPDIPTGMI